MNWIQELAGMPAISRLGEVLLHFVWQGAAVAAVLGLALAALRRASPNTRYGTACIALLSLAVLPLFTWTWLGAGGANHIEVTAVAMPGSRINSMVLPPSVRSFTARWVEPGLPWLTLGWGVGVSLFGLRLLGGWGRVQRLVAVKTRPADSPWPETVRELAARFGIHRAVALWESLQVRTPMVLGWLKPVILLPVGLAAGLSPDQMRGVLAHELAHIRRHDYLMNLFQCVVESLLFYHPAVWWVSRRIRIERELCCDDLASSVLKNRRVLAEALVTLAERESVNLTLALGAAGGTLTERVQRLLQEPPLSPAPSRLGFALTLLLAFGLGAGGLWLGQYGFNRTKTLPGITRPTAGIDRLQEQVSQLDKQIEDRQKGVDQLITDLRIPDAIVENGLSFPLMMTASIENLEAQVNELEGRVSKERLEIERLRAMSGRNLHHALNKSYSTPMLGTLLADLAIAEQQVTTLTERYLPRHPKFIQATELVARINSRIDEVARGIMNSLESQLIADEGRLAQANKSLEEAQVEQARDIASYRPFFRARKELDTLRRMREAIFLQLNQERINAAVSDPDGR